MIPLPTAFEGRADQRDYVFTVKQRTGDVVLLEKVFKPHIRCDPGSDRGLSYEVCVVKRLPQTTFPNGKVTEAHEILPAPSEWGSLGWSYSNLVDAQRRFDSLTGQPTGELSPA